jgi:hypothetical protein
MSRPATVMVQIAGHSRSFRPIRFADSTVAVGLGAGDLSLSGRARKLLQDDECQVSP